MSQPIIRIQSRPHEIELAFSSFEDDAALEAAVDEISALRYDAVPLSKWLVGYGDPTKKSLYRYGIHIPKNVDVEQLMNWLVEQLRMTKNDGSVPFHVDHTRANDTMSH
ncbi:MAG: hypothetical protein ABI690_18620 [Chloroflexota bacterium]